MKGILNMNTIIFHNDITPDTIRNLISDIKKIQLENPNEIHINMSSNGGWFSSAFEAYNFIKNSPIPIHIHNDGHIDSSALVIYLATPLRTASINSTFFIHPPRQHFDKDATLSIEELENIVLELKNIRNDYAKLLDDNTSLFDDGSKLSEHLFSVGKTFNATCSSQVGLCLIE